MHLDHFVLHVDSREVLLNLAPKAAEAGFPFDPKKGKGDKGFHATNIWIGREYFEIAWLKQPSGGAWIPEWVERYQQGARGLTCLFLRTTKLDDLAKDFGEKEIPYRIERTSFKVLFGLYTVKLPWRILLLPTIPGADFEISFIEYDPGSIERYSKYWKPNATSNGVKGISSAQINVPNLPKAAEFLMKVFSATQQSDDRLLIPVDGGLIEVLESPGEASVTLFADADSALPGAAREFEIGNVRVVPRTVR